MHADVLEPLVQAANDVEDEGAVGDRLTQGAKLIHHLVAGVAGVGEQSLLVATLASFARRSSLRARSSRACVKVGNMVELARSSAVVVK